MIDKCVREGVYVFVCMQKLQKLSALTKQWTKNVGGLMVHTIAHE